VQPFDGGGKVEWGIVVVHKGKKTELPPQKQLSKRKGSLAEGLQKPRRVTEAGMNSLIKIL